MTYERAKAIQESACNAASDAYFKARHEMLDTRDRRNVFSAGFDRGYGKRGADVDAMLSALRSIVDDYEFCIRTSGEFGDRAESYAETARKVIAQVEGEQA